MINGTARNHRMARPALACGVFCEFFATNGKDLFFILFYIQQEIVKSGALSRNLSTTYDYTPPGRGKWYEKILITTDFHILP